MDTGAEAPNLPRQLLSTRHLHPTFDSDFTLLFKVRILNTQVSGKLNVLVMGARTISEDRQTNRPQ